MQPQSKNLGPMTLEKSEGGMAHWLYDLSIPDVEERASKRLWFASAAKLAAYLEISDGHISQHRGVGKRIYSIKWKKDFAIRLAHEQR